MADATRVSGNIAGTPVKQARFSFTANDDVLFVADGAMLILGAIHHSANKYRYHSNICNHCLFRRYFYRCIYQ